MALTMSDVIATEAVDRTWDWLCRNRRDYPDASDIWDLRRHWAAERPQLCHQLLAGDYRFALLSRIRHSNREVVDLWGARDALVLKCLAQALGRHLPRSRRCYHLARAGTHHTGHKAAVRAVLRAVPHYRFVLKTDVKSYYASIDHRRLLESLKPWVADHRLLGLVRQYLKRTAERGGLFYDYDRGIPLGSPLSPVLGTFFLYRLDRALARRGYFYLRYMDDILVLAPSRWKLRSAVRALNRTLARTGSGEGTGKNLYRPYGTRL